MSHKSKLAELRAKTDRQLVALFQTMLDDGLRRARASGGDTRPQAEDVYAEVLYLLPTIRHIAEAERRALDVKLARLRYFLDRRPTPAVARMQAC